MSTTKTTINGTKYTANIPTQIIEDVKMKHPNKEISICFNTECDLSLLEKGESVCWGDGETFFFVLKDKS